MTRRIFLAGSTALAAAPALLARRAPTTTNPARTLRKAAMIGMVGEGETILEKFRVLRDCGFEGVECDSPSPVPVGEILEAQEKTGIVVHGLVDSKHWGKPLNHPEPAVRAEGAGALETCLRDAKRLGSTSVLLVPGVVNDKMPYDECYRLSQEAIRAALPVARECGVTIAVENVWNNFLLSPLEAARYVDEFADPRVAFHFDIGNVINFGRPAQWVKILGRRIVKLHIKDFSLKKRDEQGLWKGFDVELGEGDAGWAGVMAALDQTGYSTATPGNWATAEVRGGDRARLTRVSEQMSRLFAS
jgi:hexulose-6-phosphate isomerase